jgi:nicotinamide-nucleotide amidase
MIDDELARLAQSTLAACRARELMIATAESCTGGLVSAALTSIAGSSDVFERGFVTYSNEAKQEMIGVPGEIIAKFGAVSEECARAMAEGTLRHSRADIAVSITGIAGPAGGTPQKPVGLVWIACAMEGIPTQTRRLELADRDRTEIRQAAAVAALEMIIAKLDRA